MKSETGQAIYLKDYAPHDYVITDTYLNVQLGFSLTHIQATHQVTCRTETSAPLVLDSDVKEITQIKVDDVEVSSSDYTLINKKLTLHNVPKSFELEIHNTISPESNTALSGLYQSGDMVCTQCEAEGFRCITPSIDRPDNLATYTVKLQGNQSLFPVLLSNGNQIHEAETDQDGNHSVTWHDPFPKPTYLFAIVAGPLACLEDQFTTMSSQNVTLRFYARDRDIEKCHFAMEALKRSMLWDEEKYGREYDLELFNVVAVSDFNMGAMENKSLNIFNTKYVLADPKMATDADYQNIESVIGHEYFHNWSGNRVTCRDWFQLSLKEGFTVFRDQEFSRDMSSRGVKRIEDVNILRNHQFREDAGPMAHSVRPDSYYEINNFYTVTIYNKGAEVVRMIHTLLGADLFRQGCDHYFSQFDGQAVTTDDFIDSMESIMHKSNNQQLKSLTSTPAHQQSFSFEQFKNWYQQAGTPRVNVTSEYDDENHIFTLNLEQFCHPTPGQTDKAPFVIPLKTALFGQSGNKLEFELNGETNKLETTLILNQSKQQFSFTQVKEKPIPSLLREFSAPIILRQNLTHAELGILFAHDDNTFSRWEAGQNLALHQLIKSVEDIQNGKPVTLNPALANAFSVILTETHNDLALAARLITLPGEAYISEQFDVIDPQAIHQAKIQTTELLATHLKDALLQCYHAAANISTGSNSPEESGARSFRDACLHYLTTCRSDETDQLVLNQFNQSQCMTDSIAALTELTRTSLKNRFELIETFYETWCDEPLIIDKWLRLQATIADSESLSRVQKLSQHPAFEYTNPNKVYSLLAAFAHANPSGLHQEEGKGYEFLGYWIMKLDPINPNVAARLVSAFNNWRRFKPTLQSLMKKQLLEILELNTLSPDVSEIVNKALSSD